VWLSPNGQVQQTLIVDETQGMAPVSVEASMPGSEFVLTRGSTTWEEKATGVWVPTSSTMQGFARGGTSAKYVLTWKSVNAAIPAKSFEASEFALPMGTAIVDYRSGTPKVESVVGQQPLVKAS